MWFSFPLINGNSVHFKVFEVPDKLIFSVKKLYPNNCIRSKPVNGIMLQSAHIYSNIIYYWIWFKNQEYKYNTLVKKLKWIFIFNLQLLNSDTHKLSYENIILCNNNISPRFNCLLHRDPPLIILPRITILTDAK